MASLFNLLFSLRGGAWCFLLYSLWQLSASLANCFEAETDRRDRGNEKDQGDERLRGTMWRDVYNSPLPSLPGACHSLASARLECPYNQHIDAAGQTTGAGAALYCITTTAACKSPETNTKEREDASFTLLPSLSHVC